ncbi:hypothetical protein [Flavobacterium cerinum]|uniref:hypothetical protein n=1 Tax=Flavobacterium cerinum TaxID=2502784 RepID=UPI0013E28BA0|nr:hypothetical protein [Flavobacterium cerinum]
MTKAEIENKIKDVDVWLGNNPNHYDYAVNWRQKQDYERMIKNKEYDEPTRAN